MKLRNFILRLIGCFVGCVVAFYLAGLSVEWDNRMDGSEQINIFLHTLIATLQVTLFWLGLLGVMGCIILIGWNCYKYFDEGDENDGYY